ncbi:hypothetical protein [Paramaledivibacter caminithermalis]|jgi:hypothetical protein|uniref:Uncharacterized protein n=1 Tax=Paramaledivibacter caminithermalis (strain DSM 15212 / CIP 107654 / DViRD3) TaxID=1121301 RepID=A0A1M6QWX9_PARC5|nr:hypothetical protein [Paramaledivibacter caminithermalis]SHK24577.1 hypothetical protein SAMN02745912_02761 [Paramaledivibacter caminithermalis DSM 15212]
MLLKSTLSDIGLPVKSKISSEDFYEYLIDKPSLIERLLEGISLDGMVNVEGYQAPLLKGVEKLTKLQREEKYVLDTVLYQLESENLGYNKRDIQINMVHHYLKNTAFMRTDAKINMFDFVVELLTNLSMINTSTSLQEVAVTKEVIEEDLNDSESIDLANISRDDLKSLLKGKDPEKYITCEVCQSKIKVRNMLRHYDKNSIKRIVMEAREIKRKFNMNKNIETVLHFPNITATSEGPIGFQVIIGKNNLGKIELLDSTVF